MGDDWDPFADPADGPAEVQKAGTSFDEIWGSPVGTTQLI